MALIHKIILLLIVLNIALAYEFDENEEAKFFQLVERMIQKRGEAGRCKSDGNYRRSCQRSCTGELNIGIYSFDHDCPKDNPICCGKELK